MSRKNNTDEESSPPEGFRLGKDISCAEMSCHQIAVTPEGTPAVYLSYVDRDVHGYPFAYSPGVADRRDGGRSDYRFVSLKSGNLAFSSFLWDDHAYKILDDRVLFLPSGANNYFGVIDKESREEDEALTRRIFGVTLEELEDFLPILNGVLEGRMDDSYWARKHSRCTFSKTRDNECDLSNAWIPPNFPFIAFGDTSYFRGHLSFHGLFRFLAFTCHRHSYGNERRPFGFMKSLADAGASMDVMDGMISAFFAGQNPIIRLGDAFRR